MGVGGCMSVCGPSFLVSGMCSVTLQLSFVSCLVVVVAVVVHSPPTSALPQPNTTTTTTLLLQDVDWEFQDQAADDDVDQGASEEEGLADDPGYRKQLGE